MRKRVAAVIGTVALVLSAIFSTKILEYQDADKILVVQSPAGGLTFYTEPGGGIKWQGFGNVTYYPRRGQFWFSAKDDQGKAKDESIQVRFNDGGHANVSGSLAWEMPIDKEHLVAIHTKYGGTDAIESQLIRPTIEKAVYMSGPLMSSKESAAEKRTMLLSYIEDQIQHGVYKTETIQEKQHDPVTGQERTVNIVQLARSSDGQIVRTDVSPFEEFGIRTFNLSVNQVKYDQQVEQQIAGQQQLAMQVQTAIAEAKTAEQRALTAEQNGKAAAAQAKWEQEVEKARAVTAAEKERDVAQLGVQTAELRKKAAILEGEGEGAKKAAIQRANGSLEMRLEAYKQVQSYWADAFSKHQGPLVPNVVMGSATGQNAPGNAASFVELMTMKAAKDLQLNLQGK
jgi:regulator of protease activity HflC (stomatin/prohibitin superfamily)